MEDNQKVDNHLEDEVISEDFKDSEDINEPNDFMSEDVEVIDDEDGQEVEVAEENDDDLQDDEVKIGKKEKKDKKDIQIEELTDRVKRTMAEFDNFRKRTEKEKASMFEIGAKSIIEKILPIIDNFERGLGAVSEEDLKEPFAEGMEKIYKQMVKMLEDIGVAPIEALEKEFNPEFHNAVMHVEDENYGENIVVEEFQKGYTYKESVIRHSMVKVAN